MTDLTVITEPIDLAAIRNRACAAPPQLRAVETLDDETDLTWFLIIDADGKEYAAVPAEMTDFADWIVNARTDIHSLLGAAAQREEQARDLEQARELLWTALTLVVRGEDPRANRTFRRFEHEARAFLSALNKPGEETP